jgi:hypothetical protein
MRIIEDGLIIHYWLIHDPKELISILIVGGYC